MATSITPLSFDLSNVSVDQVLLRLGSTNADLERIGNYWEYVSPRIDVSEVTTTATLKNALNTAFGEVG